MPLELDETLEDSVCTIRVSGEVDLSSSPRLRTAIIQRAKAKYSVDIELFNVEYMDSSGVATLVEGLKLCKGHDKAFRLLRPSEAVMKVLRLAQLDKLFAIEYGDSSESTTG